MTYAERIRQLTELLLDAAFDFRHAGGMKNAEVRFRCLDQAQQVIHRLVGELLPIAEGLEKEEEEFGGS